MILVRVIDLAVSFLRILSGSIEVSGVARTFAWFAFTALVVAVGVAAGVVVVHLPALVALIVGIA